MEKSCKKIFWVVLLWLVAPFVWAEPIGPDTVTATFTVDQTTEDEFSAHISLQNKADAPLQQWSLGFTFQRTITKITGAHFVKQIGDYYVVSGDGANATIP